jgi:hypothetical protein
VWLDLCKLKWQILLSISSNTSCACEEERRAIHPSCEESEKMAKCGSHLGRARLCNQRRGLWTRFELQTGTKGFRTTDTAWRALRVDLWTRFVIQTGSKGRYRTGASGWGRPGQKRTGSNGGIGPGLVQQWVICLGPKASSPLVYLAKRGLERLKAQRSPIS